MHTSVCVCMYKTRNAIRHNINYNIVYYNICAVYRSWREDCVAWEAAEKNGQLCGVHRISRRTKKSKRRSLCVEFFDGRIDSVPMTLPTI